MTAKGWALEQSSDGGENWRTVKVPRSAGRVERLLDHAGALIYQEWCHPAATEAVNELRDRGIVRHRDRALRLLPVP